MKIFLSPQVNDNERILYSFKGDEVIVTIGGITDTFDFTGVPDGVLTLNDLNTGESIIKTSLVANPILSAEKKDGILYLELLNWIGADASQEEEFPEWIDSSEYVRPSLVVETEEEKKAREEEFAIMPEGEVKVFEGNSLEGWGEV